MKVGREASGKLAMTSDGKCTVFRGVCLLGVTDKFPL